MAYMYCIDKEKTGLRIRELRMQNGLRVTDISDYMGFEDPQAVYKWQSGKTMPSLDNMIALARLYHTTIEDIVVLSGEADEASPFCEAA